MKKLIVYFHGYNSSPKTDKAAKLKEDFETLAVSIHPDPEVALEKVIREIDYFLIDHFTVPIELTFVGTSLGAWWASKLAKAYDCKAVLINPSTNPSKTLPKLGLSEEIASKYNPIDIPPRAAYFIAEDDEVINNKDFTQRILDLNDDRKEVFTYPDGGHRFNGEYFERVMSYLNK